MSALAWRCSLLDRLSLLWRSFVWCCRCRTHSNRQNCTMLNVPVHDEEAPDIAGSRYRRFRRWHGGALFSTASLFFGAVSSGVAVARADQQEQCVTDTEPASCTASALWLDQIFPRKAPPDSPSLDGAWEHSPLLSTIYEDDSRTRGLAPIPTLVVPDERKSDNDGGSNDLIPPYRRHPQRFDGLLSLFSVNDVETVLS